MGKRVSVSQKPRAHRGDVCPVGFGRVGDVVKVESSRVVEELALGRLERESEGRWDFFTV